MSDNLAKNILTTVVYYDVLDFPLTSFEIWKYLTRVSQTEKEDAGCSLQEVVEELEKENIKRVISSWRGYYFLRGRELLVEQRLDRNKIAETKYEMLRKVVWWMRFVPFVRMVAVTGRLAMKNTEIKSDLDLLIVLKHGRIFTGRTLVTLLVHLMGKRRYGKKITNRVCLNYFITTKSLEISLKDLFASSEYSFILPLSGFKYFRRFQKNNGWIGNYKVNYVMDEISNLKMLKDTHLTKGLRKAGEQLLNFDFIEKSLRKWQVRRIANDPRTEKLGSVVMANDDNLIFLPEPKGPEVFGKFVERLKSFSSQS